MSNDELLKAMQDPDILEQLEQLISKEDIAQAKIGLLIDGDNTNE